MASNGGNGHTQKGEVNINANGISSPRSSRTDLELIVIAQVTFETARDTSDVRAGSIHTPRSTALRVLRALCYREVGVRGPRPIGFGFAQHSGAGLWMLPGLVAF